MYKSHQSKTLKKEKKFNIILNNLKYLILRYFLNTSRIISLNGSIEFQFSNVVAFAIPSLPVLFFCFNSSGLVENTDNYVLLYSNIK